MLLVMSLLKWWYTDGWRKRVLLVSNRLDGTLDYFSMGLLLKTLFSPYRQISAGRVEGSLEVQLRALVDKLFSRVIGAFIRLIILLVGVIAILLTVVIGFLALIIWALVPFLPIAGTILTLTGMAP